MAGFERIFADCDAAGGGEIDLIAGWDRPAGGGEKFVDFGERQLLRGHAKWEFAMVTDTSRKRLIQATARDVPNGLLRLPIDSPIVPERK